MERIVRLVIESVAYDVTKGEAAITLKDAGLSTVSQELCRTDSPTACNHLP